MLIYVVFFMPDGLFAKTSGGLLAVLPRSKAPACVAALQQAGYHQAAVIGVVNGKTETDATFAKATSEIDAAITLAHHDTSA